MEDEDIYKLFLSVLENSAQDRNGVREVFSILIKSTLRYRDQMLASKGRVVTVEDVRTALKWLVPSLSTGLMPKTDNKISLDLLKLWLDELKAFGNPKIYFS